jgi:RNA polymerase sigma-70 factor (ECF subfamily)
MTDGELVRQVLEGRTTAREELARRWAPRVLAVCQSRIGRDAGEDVAQDALWRGLSALDQLDSVERFGPWIRSIAIRLCIDWLRRRRLMERPWSSLPESAETRATVCDGPSPLEAADEKRRLWSAIGALPEELREVLLLFYCDQHSYESVAQLLDVSRATVNSRLARARQSLRLKLEQPRERDHGLHQRS